MQTALQFQTAQPQTFRDRQRLLAARHELSRQIHATLNPDHRQSFGQVLTPPNVADYMGGLLAQKVGHSFVDAGAGYGILSHAGNLRGVILSPHQANLVDVDPHMVEFLRRNPPVPGASVIQSDFVTWALRQGRTMDFVVQNPPYLSCHDYDTGLVGIVNEVLGTDLSKLTNLFSLFLLAGAHILAPGGRLVIIIPTELWTTGYGKRTLESIPAHAHVSQVHVFGPHNEPFKQACTTSCIVVLDAGPAPEAVEVFEIDGTDGELQGRLVDSVPWATVQATPKRVVNGVLHRDLQGFVPLGDLLQVSRGMSTGDNDFFLIDGPTRNRIDPQGRCTQRVWKNAKDGARYFLTAQDHEDLVSQGEPRWLLRVEDYDSAPDAIRAYLDEGRRRGLPQRNVCGNRSPWFKQESHTPGRLLLGAMYRDHCRAILNPDAISTLACFHRAVDKPGSRLTDGQLTVLAGWLNTKAGQDSIREVSRRYGSGMFVLVPSDSASIFAPDVRNLSEPSISAVQADIEDALRAKDSSRLEDLIARVLTP